METLLRFLIILEYYTTLLLNLVLTYVYHGARIRH